MITASEGDEERNGNSSPKSDWLIDWLEKGPVSQCYHLKWIQVNAQWENPPSNVPMHLGMRNAAIANVSFCWWVLIITYCMPAVFWKSSPWWRRNNLYCTGWCKHQPAANICCFFFFANYWSRKFFRFMPVVAMGSDRYVTFMLFSRPTGSGACAKLFNKFNHWTPLGWIWKHVSDVVFTYFGAMEHWLM